MISISDYLSIQMEKKLNLLVFDKTLRLRDKLTTIIKTVQIVKKKTLKSQNA